jgi:hypothetical protein
LEFSPSKRPAAGTRVITIERYDVAVAARGVDDSGRRLVCEVAAKDQMIWIGGFNCCGSQLETALRHQSREGIATGSKRCESRVGETGE